MKRVLPFLFSLAAATTFAQDRTFDIATFTPPPGWSEELKDYAASYVRTDNILRTWCRVTIYKSIGSSGDAMVDYQSEWRDLIAKNKWGPADAPAPESEVEDGWTSHTGAGTFTFENQPAVAVLGTISGYGRAMSFVVLTNGQEFEKEIAQFMASVKLSKPEQPAVPAPASQSVASQSVASSPVAGAITVTAVPDNHGMTYATTNFDDGWVAQAYADYVRVAKGETVALLHFGIPITDELRDTYNLEATLFDRIILPRYNVTNIRKFDNGGPCYLCVHFFEADAVEKSTGKRYHLGFRVIAVNGVAKCIEILSPSQAAFQQVFPQQEKVEAMLNYNKFAVDMKDVVGDWTSSSGSAVQLYSVVTGAAAGMNASSSTDEFKFRSDGTYESNHSGAYGMVGSQNFYKQNFKGELTVSNWEIVLTKQFDGKTKTFWAQYEAIRGGRMLHLTDKQYSGSQFHLTRKQ